MERQLVLMEAVGHDWSLDEETRQTGRRGVEQAREALRLARLEALREAERHSTAA